MSQFDKRLMACTRLYSSGKYSRAASKAYELAEDADRIDDLWIAAKCHQLLGVILVESGNPELGLKSYLDAEKRLLLLGESVRETFAQIQFEISSLFLRLGLDAEADEYLERARFSAVGEPFSEHISWHDRLLIIQAIQDWKIRVRSCLDALAELDQLLAGTPDSDVARVDMLIRSQIGLTYVLARDLVVFGDGDQAEDGFIRAAGMAVVMGADDPLQFLRFADILTEAVSRPGIDLSDILTQVIHVASKLRRQLGKRTEFSGFENLFRGLREMQSHNREPALEFALKALVDFTATVSGLGSAELRGAFSDRLAASFDMALILAIDQNEGELVAELIESSRLQSLPSHNVTSPAVDSDDALDLVGLLAQSPVSEYSCVSVNGVSRIARASRQGWGSGPRVVSLEDVIGTVGGASSWWWAVRLASARIYWCIRSPVGSFETGYKELSSLDQQALTGLYKDFVFYGTDGYLARPPAEEIANSKHIANLVMPDTLKLAVSSGDAQSIVVSGNELSILGLPALILQEEDETRLVEQAVIRVQPPAVIADWLRARLPAQSVKPGRWPLLISCMDPQSNLEYAFHPDVTARTSLVGTGRMRASDVLASVQNFRKGVITRPNSAHGILFFAGHSSGGSFGRAGQAALQMADGAITAHDLIDLAGSRAGYCFPDRVLLASCDSSGSAGSGAGQWLGLSAAFLVGGTRQVVATAWSIPDLPGTFEFEEKLLTRLGTDPDAAQALAEVQREFLREWRRAGRTSRSVNYSPLVWAAFQSIGSKI